MDKRRLPLCLCLLVFLLWGCGSVREYLEIARDKGVSKEYGAALADWTRSQVAYSQFETRLRITATFKGRAFQKAYLAEYARIYVLSDDERRKREDAQTQLAGDCREIFFYAYIPEKDYNDFEKRQSTWTVFLQDERGGRIEPLELRRIEKVTPMILEFFPYVNPHYGRCYSLKVPPVSDEDFRNLKIVFTGVLGRIELAWK